MVFLLRSLSSTCFSPNFVLLALPLPVTFNRGDGSGVQPNNTVMDDESGELMELMEEVPLKELGDAKLERLVRG